MFVLNKGRGRKRRKHATLTTNKKDSAKPIDRTRRLSLIICVNRGRMAQSGQTEDVRAFSNLEIYPDSFLRLWNKARSQHTVFMLLSTFVSAFRALL